jgi:DNA (cytosine-5)-methyltransferase 1
VAEEQGRCVPLKVIELFAGVGGFRLGLQDHGFETVWSSQWEPKRRVQHASDCYIRHFGDKGHSNRDIASVSIEDIPDHDLLVGGFPCQDYSVATTKAQGINGKKGVLWWEIDRIVRAKLPKYLLLENVDRLLRSPTHQRGRDFGILLGCLAEFGYRVEWRALNAADYGFPQKRRRTFIFAAHESTPWGAKMAERGGHPTYNSRDGFFGAAFPVRERPVLIDDPREADAEILPSLQETSDQFRADFCNAGVMVDGVIWTSPVSPAPASLRTLRDILEPKVDAKYIVPDIHVPKWRYLKGAKAEERMTKDGFTYRYTEGGIPFPDNLDSPSRTLITNEGGVSPSRFKHIIQDPKTSKFRVLTPVECERLNGFPAGWTAGMPERWRYFCMGNALVVGLVDRMGARLAETAALGSIPSAKVAAKKST